MYGFFSKSFLTLLLQNKVKISIFGCVPLDKACDEESSSSNLLGTCSLDKGRKESKTELEQISKQGC